MSFLALLTVFLVTFLASILVIATERWHGHFSLDGLDGVQKHHEEPTPRIGGLAIFTGLATSWFMTTGEEQQIVKVILLAGMPALLFGLAEDVTKEVGVLPRLLATMASGALAWYMTGVAMQNTGFPPLDIALQYLPIAVVFTAFAVGGVANSINIIDGFNGLASGCVAIMLGALGVMSLQAGDASFARVCFLAACCALGFAAVNWPFGKIFLGDGGAYLLGFVLAWMAVLLPMRNVGINAWATILICAYPVIEVGSSVLRRRKRDGHHPGQPDNVHLHHLVNRRVIRKVFPSMSSVMQNGMTSPICWALASLPATWAIYFAKNTPMLVLGFCLEVVVYMALYARLSQFRWCISAVTLKKTSNAKGLQPKLPF